MLEEKIAQLIENGENVLWIIVDKIMEEAPILVNEILTYNIFRHIVIAIICLIPTIILAIYTKKAYTWYSKQSEQEKLADPIFAIPLLISICSFLCLIPTIVHTFFMCKIIFAPRLFLLEYVQTLVN